MVSEVDLLTVGSCRLGVSDDSDNDAEDELPKQVK